MLYYSAIEKNMLLIHAKHVSGVSRGAKATISRSSHGVSFIYMNYIFNFIYGIRAENNDCL